MLAIREHLNSHKNQGLRDPDKDNIPPASDLFSQYGLLNFIFSKFPSVANMIMEDQIQRHSDALKIQKQLLQYEPALASLLVSISLNPSHPLRHEREYLEVNRLLNESFPLSTDNNADVLNWKAQLDVALLSFIRSTMICTSFINNPNARESLSPSSTTSSFSSTPSPMIYQTESMRKYDIFYLEDIRVHGFNQRGLEIYIDEIAKAHKFFLARKLSILKELEPSSKLVVGVFTVLLRVKDAPPIFLGYQGENLTNVSTTSSVNFTVRGDHLKNNNQTTGVDFCNVHPVICIHEKCHKENKCSDSHGNTGSIFVKVGSVDVGEPPLAARNTFDFPKIEMEWRKEALKEASGAPGPMRRNKYREDKSFRKNERFSWKPQYLKFLANEFKKRNSLDEVLLKEHFIYATDGASAEGKILSDKE
ncbi:hypothetical protein GCK72_023163 [Caenorhabditis remanei]|uniref:Uncharacterized protein n=1 Tax=Caenorhabditis remanei TaxID=31234 RepID=A0A6A5FVV9_CAERE|nr:hypothetical protein GCK72_023163 [Caenorhabditis remanei]KAF1746706.1 hypothetical protein GCK72_023163 [Caenorhabditis remanei]